VIETAPGELEAQTVFNRIRFGGIVVNLKTPPVNAYPGSPDAILR
jgi:hypothetical protein